MKGRRLSGALRIRSAVLLIGGDKTGKIRLYEEYIPIADWIYDEHVAQLKREGLM
jgi:hypothetical protein